MRHFCPLYGDNFHSVAGSFFVWWLPTVCPFVGFCVRWDELSAFFGGISSIRVIKRFRFDRISSCRWHMRAWLTWTCTIKSLENDEIELDIRHWTRLEQWNDCFYTIFVNFQWNHKSKYICKNLLFNLFKFKLNLIQTESSWKLNKSRK